MVSIQVSYLAMTPAIFDKDLSSDMVSFGLIVFCSILSIAYVTIIIVLKHTLKRMNEFGDFNDEQKTVIR